MGVTKEEMRGMGLVEQEDGSWEPKGKKKKSATMIPFKTKPEFVQAHDPSFPMEYLTLPDLQSHKLLITFPVTPIGKVRMVKSDAWKKRPEVLRYWVYKDQLVSIAKGANFTMPEAFWWMVCYIPMARSWSKKKKKLNAGCPHKQKPDKDNIEKGILDSLCRDDSHIWDGRITKIWCYEGEGRIEIYQT
jgi:Holliday junction resolvase RusA-like endonuclease